MKNLPKFSREGHLAKKLQSPGAVTEYEKILIGKMIRKLRIEKNMHQEALARLVKTSQSAIARIEHGKQNVSLHMLITISIALGKKLRIEFVK